MNIFLISGALIVTSVVLLTAEETFVWYKTNLFATLMIFIIAAYLLLTFIRKDLPSQMLLFLALASVVCSAVQFFSVKRNHIEFMGDRIIVHRGGKSTEYCRDDIQVETDERRKTYDFIVDGKTYNVLKGGHEDFEKWLGV